MFLQERANDGRPEDDGRDPIAKEVFMMLHDEEKYWNKIRVKKGLKRIKLPGPDRHEADCFEDFILGHGVKREK